MANEENEATADGEVRWVRDMPVLQIADLTGHPNDEGLNWELISQSICAAGDLNIGLYRMSPNEYHPRHVHHSSSEFYYIYEGTCIVTLGTREIEAGAGAAIYIPPDTVHAIRTRDNECMSMVYGFPVGEFSEAGTEWLE